MKQIVILQEIKTYVNTYVKPNENAYFLRYPLYNI